MEDTRIDYFPSSLDENELQHVKENVRQLYSNLIADHFFTLKEQNEFGKVFGYGVSPYVKSDVLHNKHNKHDLEVLRQIFLEMMDCMSCECQNHYDVLILSGNETIYAPNQTITILFLKK